MKMSALGEGAYETKRHRRRCVVKLTAAGDDLNEDKCRRRICGMKLSTVGEGAKSNMHV
jgi:hypothetical protein